MSVDKFGRYDHNFVRDKKTPKTLFTLTKSGDHDAMNKLIRNVKEPILTNDAATKGYVLDKVLKQTDNNNYDCEGKLIQNVGDPTLPSDAVTVKYMKRMTPTVNEDHWGFSNKRLSNVKEPLYGGEAVNLAALQFLTVCKKRKEKGTYDEIYDAKNLRIANVGDCEQDGDVVNKRRLDEKLNELKKDGENQMQRFGRALFRYIHRSTGRSAESGVDNTNFLDWNEIYGFVDPKEYEEEHERNKRI